MDTQTVSQKTSPRDIFLHLLAIITLYISAGSFIALLFQFINIYLPDPLNSNYYSARSAYGAMRFSLASLVVFFPAFVATTRFLNKSYEAEPDKRNLRIRKWLVYFTLFVGALIMMGDLVTLIYRFLGGELTLRFVLQVLVVFFVAGSVFWYYFWDLKQHKGQ